MTTYPSQVADATRTACEAFAWADTLGAVFSTSLATTWVAIETFTGLAVGYAIQSANREEPA